MWKKTKRNSHLLIKHCSSFRLTHDKGGESLYNKNKIQ